MTTLTRMNYELNNLFIYLKESNVFYRFVFAITYYSNYPEQIEHIAFILKKKNYENTTMPSDAKYI